MIPSPATRADYECAVVNAREAIVQLDALPPNDAKAMLAIICPVDWELQRTALDRTADDWWDKECRRIWSVKADLDEAQMRWVRRHTLYQATVYVAELAEELRRLVYAIHPSFYSPRYP
jgi:hypothetical protein